MKKKLAILFLTVWAWGCSAPPISTAVSPVPTGWTSAKTQDGKLKVAIPADWVVADSKDPKFKETMADLAKSNPALANMNTGNYYFMALDRKAKEGFSDNVNVVKKSLPQAMPFNDEGAKALKAELAKSMPVQAEIEMELTKVPFGRAYRYRVPLKFSTSRGDFITYAIGYLVCQETDLYIVTFSTTPKYKDTFTDTARQVMDTFSVGS